MAEPAVVDPRALARALDRLARAEGAPWLHQEVARRMAQRLPVIRQAPQRWLDWWAFTGGGEAPVRTVWPAAQRVAVEPTAHLQQRSRQAMRKPWWTLGRRSDPGGVLLEAEVPPASAQMLWANMVLHAAPQPVQLLARWHGALAVDGFLMFSTLGPDSLRELRAIYAAMGWQAPHPPFTDMHDIGDQLVHGGFSDPVMDQETVQLTWSSPQALLDELRTLGGNLWPARFPGLRTPRWRQRLLAALAERADGAGRIGMSFEIVYGHAFKAAPRPAAGAPVAVSLEQVRASLASRRGKPEAS